MVIGKSIYLSVLLVFKLVSADINISVTCGRNVSDITVTHTGRDEKIVDVEDTKQYGIRDNELKEHIKVHLGKKPTDVFLKSPTPWGDLYKEYHWEQVKRILKVKSATIMGINYKPVIVHSQDFENAFNNTIKVNTGISHTVETTVTTSWSKTNEFQVSQEIEYKLDVLFAKIKGVTGFSYTSAFGQTVEKSEAVTIGTTSGMETELNPGQSCTAVLSANKRYFEVEVKYIASLKGVVAVNYKKRFHGHHFYGPSIADVLESAGKVNEKTITENIRIGFYSDASLKVYDKMSGLPL